MGTDWIWAVAIVLACFGWVNAMVDRKDNEMEHLFAVSQEDIRRKPTGRVAYRMLTVRPDRILEMMGDLVDQYGTRSGWSLLWDMYYDLKFSRTLTVAAVVAVYVQDTADSRGCVWDDVFAIAGRSLVDCLDTWADNAEIDVNDSAEIVKGVSTIRDYFSEQGLLDRLVVGQFFMCNPDLVNMLYPYVSIPTHKFIVNKQWPEDDRHQVERMS